MATYIVFRKGSNRSNQPMREIAPLFIMEASSRKEGEAILNRLVQDGEITCYGNQVCYLKHRAHTRKEDYEEALENSFQ